MLSLSQVFVMVDPNTKRFLKEGQPFKDLSVSISSLGLVVKEYMAQRCKMRTEERETRSLSLLWTLFLSFIVLGPQFKRQLPCTG